MGFFQRGISLKIGSARAGGSWKKQSETAEDIPCQMSNAEMSIFCSCLATLSLWQVSAAFLHPENLPVCASLRKCHTGLVVSIANVPRTFTSTAVTLQAVYLLWLQRQHWSPNQIGNKYVDTDDYGNHSSPMLCIIFLLH